jgi:hypothetical protein
MSLPFHWLIAACLSFLFLTTPGCGPINPADNLPGTYVRRDSTALPGYLQKIRLTEDKFIIASPLGGEIAQAYTVDHNNLYVGGPDGQICFRIEGLGVISNRGMLGMEGTYVKQVGGE